MRRALALALALAFAAPVSADRARGAQADPCAKVAEMMQTAAEARSEYDGLVAAIREVPDRPGIQAFGFERLAVQKAMLEVERLHGRLTPEQIGAAMAARCAGMTLEITS